MTIEIIVEIGTDEQKELIRREIEPIAQVAGDLKMPVNIQQWIVALDFDAWVNRLQRTSDYTSFRSVFAPAKAIDREDGLYIVLSPLLFTESWDNQCRSFVYLHEMAHAVQKNVFPSTPTVPLAAAQYHYMLYWSYSEYMADRLAYTIVDRIFPQKSVLAVAMLDSQFRGFCDLLCDEQHYEALCGEIDAFRKHSNVDLFLSNIRDMVSDLGVSIAHAWAMTDHYPQRYQHESFSASKFANAKTSALMQFYKTQYEVNSHDLSEGLPLLIDFMTNFGIKFEDTQNDGRLYCHVVDI